ncbi:MAG TPA: hypothetical protein VKA74_16875 [Myxococcota bacterium]|nr:hypothetical protein [Myxococcota bacterium]
MSSPRLPIFRLLGGLLLAVVVAAAPAWAQDSGSVDGARPDPAPLGADADSQPLPATALEIQEEADWEYDPYYVFPLTRHLSESGLSFPARVALYPIGFILDLGQWPVGLLLGLAGR